MRLIDVENYVLHEVQHAADENPYAILSHTWDESGTGEVSFLDMQDLNVACRKEKGWRKIEMTCRLARRAGLKWAWIDTCCIDQSSSAELSEAINSMFEWYQQAKICYVYLGDLPTCHVSEVNTGRARESFADYFPRCRWFTRGWTLQELIACRNADFFDQGWIRRGTKVSLENALSKITGIEPMVLQDSSELTAIPVARRMSWAAKRRTKRVEDVAYSLLGLFNVNMPLIYGEGTKAFIRLQDAIIHQTNDLTLFAWRASPDGSGQPFRGIFAESPRDFENSGLVAPIDDPLLSEHLSFTSYNRDLQLQASVRADGGDEGYLMNLYCYDHAIELAGGRPSVLAVQLVKSLTGFVRHQPEKLVVCPDVAPHYIWAGRMATVKIPKHIDAWESRQVGLRMHNAFRFRVESPANISTRLSGSLGLPEAKDNLWQWPLNPAHSWDRVTQTFLTGSWPTFTGLLSPLMTVDGKTGKNKFPHGFRILFGFEPQTRDQVRPSQQRQSDLKPWVYIISGQNPCIANADKGASREIFDHLQGCLLNSELYGLTVSTLGLLLHEAKAKGTNFSTKAVITPTPFDHPDRQLRQDKMVLTLSLRTTGNDRVSVHEVTIRLEPSQPNPDVLITERPLSNFVRMQGP